MQSLFLQKQEIRDLTGYKRQKDQCSQLEQMGIRFFVNKLGQPIVIRDALLEMNGGHGRHGEAMPDLEALERLL